MLLSLVVSAPETVEVTLFGPNSDAELHAAITAQLTDLEVQLESVRETEPWESTEAGQLRQVRRLLLGKRTRVAIWVETVPWRVHVADVWTGQHVQRELVLDSGGREAAALMVRSAVASFVEQEATPPSVFTHDERFRASAKWHVTRWSSSTPWAHGPLIELAWVFAEPFSLWAWGRFELATSAQNSTVRVDFQRNELALGADASFHFGRVSVRPRAGLALRVVRVTPRTVNDEYVAAAPANDVNLAAIVGAAVSVQLFGPLDAVLDGWGAIGLRKTRYQIQERDLTFQSAVEAWPVELGAALGLSVRF